MAPESPKDKLGYCLFRRALATGAVSTDTPAAAMMRWNAAMVSGDGLKFPKR